MLTLSFPAHTSFAYPKANFTRLDNLRRQTEFNRKQFKEYIEEDIFNLENEHLLVGLLQQLAIDPEWTLERVVEYTRFRANSLCTLFKITSLNHVGEPMRQGFYREGVVEHWCLIDHDKVYIEKDLDFGTMFPIVPLYSTVTKHGYKHNALRMNIRQRDPTGFGIIGVNLVELAVGWWKYMRDAQFNGTGIHAYVCRFPLVNAQLIHNQLAVINVLFEHIVNGTALDTLITTDQVVFTTVSETKLLKEYIEFIVDTLTHNRLMDLNHLIVQLVSIYKQPYFNYIRAGKAALFSQTCWVWEPAIMKLQTIYLTIANQKEYKAADINTLVKQSHTARVNNYQRIPDAFTRMHFLDMANRLNQLNKINI